MIKMATPFQACFYILNTHKGQVHTDLFMYFLNSWTDTYLMDLILATLFIKSTQELTIYNSIYS